MTFTIREAFEYIPWKLEKIGYSPGLNKYVYSNERIITTFLTSTKKNYPNIFNTIKRGMNTGNILIGFNDRGIKKLAKEAFYSSFISSAESNAFFDTESNQIILFLDKNINMLGKPIIENIVDNVVHELIHYLAYNKQTSFFATFSSDMVLFYKEFITREFPNTDLNFDDTDIKNFIKKLLSFDYDPGQKVYVKMWTVLLTHAGIEPEEASSKAQQYINLFNRLFIFNMRTKLTGSQSEIFRNIDDVYKKVFNKRHLPIVYSQEFVDPDEIIAVINADSLKSKTERLIKTIKFKDHSLKSK